MADLIDVVKRNFQEGLIDGLRQAAREGEGTRARIDDISKALQGMARVVGSGTSGLGGNLRSMLGVLNGPTGLVLGLGMAAKAMEQFAVQSQRLSNFSRDVGIAQQSVTRMQEAFQRSGRSLEEANKSIANIGHVLNNLKDLKTPFGSELMEFVQNRGPAAVRIVQELHSNIKTMGEERAFIKMLEDVAKQPEAVRRAFAEGFKMTLSEFDDFVKRMSEVGPIVQSNRKAAEEFTKIWMDVFHKLNNFDTWFKNVFMQGATHGAKNLERYKQNPLEALKDLYGGMRTTSPDAKEVFGEGITALGTKENWYGLRMPGGWVDSVLKWFSGGGQSQAAGSAGPLPPLSDAAKAKLAERMKANQNLNQFENMYRATDLAPDQPSPWKWLGNTAMEMWVEGFTRKGGRKMGGAEFAMNMMAPMGLENIPYAIKADAAGGGELRKRLQNFFGIGDQKFRGAGQSGSWEVKQTLEQGVESGVVKGLRQYAMETSFHGTGGGMGGSGYGSGGRGLPNLRYGPGGRSPRRGGAGADVNIPAAGPSGEPGVYRPQYSLTEQDLSDPVLATIAGEAQANKTSVDAVINNMFNRIGAKGFPENLYGVARQPGQYAGYRMPGKMHAAFIRGRIQAIASGSEPDITGGSNEFRASWYQGPWTQRHPDAPVIGGNRFAYNPQYGRGRFGPYAEPLTRDAIDRALKTGSNVPNNGRIDVNFGNVPAGTRVKTDGEVFNKVKIESSPQARRAGASDASYATQSYE